MYGKAVIIGKMSPERTNWTPTRSVVHPLLISGHTLPCNRQSHVHHLAG